eukprot:scaffold101630_cov63-Phaeocystis_antarctica.AAC.2
MRNGDLGRHQNVETDLFALGLLKVLHQFVMHLRVDRVAHFDEGLCAPGSQDRSLAIVNEGAHLRKLFELLDVLLRLGSERGLDHFFMEWVGLAYREAVEELAQHHLDRARGKVVGVYWHNQALRRSERNLRVPCERGIAVDECDRRVVHLRGAFIEEVGQQERRIHKWVIAALGHPIEPRLEGCVHRLEVVVAAQKPQVVWHVGVVVLDFYEVHGGVIVHDVALHGGERATHVLRQLIISDRLLAQLLDDVTAVATGCALLLELAAATAATTHSGFRPGARALSQQGLGQVGLGIHVNYDHIAPLELITTSIWRERRTRRAIEHSGV